MFSDKVLNRIEHYDTQA